MANDSRIVGFTPISPGGGQGRMNVFGPYEVKASTAVYAGELLMRAGSDDRLVKPATAGAGSSAVGVAASTVHATDTNRAVDVWDDLSNTQFEVQADTAAAANVGQHCDHTVGTGQTHRTRGGASPDHQDLIGISGNYVANADMQDAIAQCEILGKVERPNNEWGAYVKLRVRIAEHIRDGGAMA